MKCNHCNKELEDGLKFCPYCGRPPKALKTIPIPKTRVYKNPKESEPENPEPKTPGPQAVPEPLPQQKPQYRVSWHDEGAEELIDEAEEYEIKKENKRFFIIEGVLLALAVIFAAAIIYISFFHKDNYTYYTMQGNSMLDTIADGDKAASVKLEGAPQTGDIVVIPYGGDISIRRVIATGGQTLWLDYENDRIVVDGSELSEDYISGSTFSGVRENYLVPYNIPDGKVFVLGDNRAESIDSRYEEVGLIDEKDIIAKVDHIDRQ